MKTPRWLGFAFISIFVLGSLAIGVGTSPAASSVSFVVAPADAVKTQAITGTDLDQLDGTVDGPYVAVQGTPNNTITLTSNPAGISTSQATDGNGVATFTSLSLATPGTYTLTASAPNKGPATSASFHIFDTGDSCPNQGSKCDPSTGTLANRGMKADLAGTSAGGGVIGIGLDIESAPVCAGDGPQYNHGPSVLSAFWQNIAGEVVTTITISKEWDQIQSNNGVSFYQVCFTYDITGKTFKDKFGNNVTVGLLPDCTKKQGAPCVKSRTKDNKGNVLLVTRIKEDMRQH